MSDPLSVKRDDIEDVTVTLKNGVLTFEFSHSEGVDEFAIEALQTRGNAGDATRLIRTWQEEVAPDH